MAMEKVMKYQKKIEKSKNGDREKLLSYLRKLENVPMTQSILEKTKIGITVNTLRSRKDEVGEMSKLLVRNWTDMVKRNLNDEEPVSRSKASKAISSHPVNGAHGHKIKQNSTSGSRGKSNGVVAIAKESSKQTKRKLERINGNDSSKVPMENDDKNKEKNIDRQMSVEGIDASSGFSFGDLLNVDNATKKRKRRPCVNESSNPPKKIKPSTVEADIRESLSHPDVDYAEDLNRSYHKRSLLKRGKGKSEVASADADSLAPLKLNSRSQVYSGRVKATSVITLKEMCLNVLYRHIDDVGPMGPAIAFHVIQPFLERLTVAQLERIERWNQHLISDDDELWKRHAQRDFKSCPEVRQDKLPYGFTWRKLYLRLRNNNEKRLDSLTRSITAHKAKVDESERKAKIAYPCSTPKPPREVRRQQARHGTNRFDAMDLASPSLKVGGEQRQFVAPAVEVESRKPKKQSSQLKKIISNIKRMGYHR